MTYENNESSFFTIAETQIPPDLALRRKPSTKIRTNGNRQASKLASKQASKATIRIAQTVRSQDILDGKNVLLKEKQKSINFHRC